MEFKRETSMVDAQAILHRFIDIGQKEGQSDNVVSYGLRFRGYSFSSILKGIEIRRYASLYVDEDDNLFIEFNEGSGPVGRTDTIPPIIYCIPHNQLEAPARALFAFFDKSEGVIADVPANGRIQPLRMIREHEITKIRAIPKE